jgi:tRNA(Ile)-lysidine synthetase-like protein
MLEIMDMAHIKPGVYIIAVSGGVDSVVLLHMLRERPELELVIAHYDHGIRDDSWQDRELVQGIANQYELPFIYEEGKLGAHASEQQAREARYNFLRRVRAEHNAHAIITAHHQDDVIETAIHNIGRGTGPTGLASLGSIDGIIRPLTRHSKEQIIKYARAYNLAWREDSTNAGDQYRRNYIRHHIVPRFSAEDKQLFAQKIEAGRELNQKITILIDIFLKANLQEGRLRRHAFIMLDHASAREVMATWLRKSNVRNFDRKTIERLTHAAKTYQVGKQADVNGTVKLDVKKDYLALVRLER